METLDGAHVLPEGDDCFDPNATLDNPSFNIMDSGDIEKLLNEELKSEIPLEAAAPDALTGTSEAFMDNLEIMPIVEVEDNHLESLLDNEAVTQQSLDPNLQFSDFQPTPLGNSNNEMPNINSNMSFPGNNLAMPQQPNVADLQQEKMKLLNRLNEINQNQNQMSPMTMPQNSFNDNSGNMMLPNNNMMQMNAPGNAMNNPMNNNMNNNMNNAMNNNMNNTMNNNMNNNMNMGFQQQPQHEPSFTTPTVASISGLTGGTAGETPLTSFLRKKSQSSSAAARSPKQIRSVLQETPIELDNPLLQRSRMGKAPHNDTARRMALLGQTSSSSRNANWDAAASFKTSGILTKHSSETHLLRASSRGVVPRNKASSVSRENLLYSHMKKSNSKTQFQREDSLGQLLPTKRRQGFGAKHKLGISRSVPHMKVNTGMTRNGPTGTGSQGNAMW